MTQIRTGTRLATTRCQQEHVLVPEIFALGAQRAVKLAQACGAGLVERPAVLADEVHPGAVGLDIDVPWYAGLSADVREQAPHLPWALEQLGHLLVAQVLEDVERKHHIE